MHTDASKFLPIVGLHHLLLNFSAVDVLLECQQNLLRIDRFEQIIGNLRANGLVHQVFRLILCHHHDWHVGRSLLDGRQRLKSAESRHILVEKDEVVIVFSAEVDGVWPVRARLHGISLLFQENDMPFE